MLTLDVYSGRKILEKVFKESRDFGIEIYAVGGFVRDLYLGKEGTDIDFVVVGDAIEFTKAFQKKLRKSRIVTYPRFGTTMLYYNNFKLEFVTARTEHYQENSRKPAVKNADLDSDLSRRDFTINCLAMKIAPHNIGEVIDIYGGIKDIKAKIIKTPLDPEITFSDDPLRILRAVRFASQLNFEIDKKTYAALVTTRERLKIISQERITAELAKILLSLKPSIGFDILKETGILEIIFPELDQLSGVDQRQDFHHKDVFNHTLQVVDNIAEKTEKFELRLAALLHDIAKPQTKRFVEGVGWTFHGHEELGARMVERIGRRMKLPLGDIKYAQKLVRLHLRPIQLVDSQVTDSAIRRLAFEAGEEIDDLLILCRADITSKNPKKVKRFQENFDKVESRIAEVEEKDKMRSFKPAISGNDIMKLLNIPPGPLIGEIKNRIVDAILDGEIPNNSKACLDYLNTIRDQYQEDVK
jgi:putative nucleotidyltransferase with HDIG domain